MKKKQFAAFLLSGLLVLNTAIPAFAEGMTEQIAENQTQAEPYQADTEAPKLTSISIDKEEVKAPGTVTVTLNAEDVSGIEYCSVSFKNHATGRTVQNFSDLDNPFSVKLEISEYEAEGNFELDYVQILDKAGNRVTYSSEIGDEELPKPLLSFTVINDNNNVIPPVKPERPSKPSHSGSSSGTVVNYDSEKPDPADKKATEMYDFWQNVKRKIKNTEEGKTLRVAVPTEYTYMPASVMETLRLNPQVGLKLSWGKDTVVIKAGTAQPKQKLKAYWTKSALVKLYSQR